MRDVRRPPAPRSLADNAGVWKKQLLATIRKCRSTNTEVPPRAYGKYKKADVRDALRRMYKNLCCYCEGRIVDVSFDHIEHRKPKAKFPGDTFAWDNLHLSCERCNNAKRDKWDRAAPILDAARDNPIEQHLTYRACATGLRRWPKTRRGITTVEHADLDRGGLEGLPGTRASIFLEALGLIEEIKEKRTTPPAQAMLRALQAKQELAHGTVIKYALNYALDPAP